MEREEFIERFVSCMVNSAWFDRFTDGPTIEEYARETATSYWEDEGQRAEGPEECARADMSYWGDE